MENKMKTHLVALLQEFCLSACFQRLIIGVKDSGVSDVGAWSVVELPFVWTCWVDAEKFKATSDQISAEISLDPNFYRLILE